jgi:hypothetical protein
VDDVEMAIGDRVERAGIDSDMCLHVRRPRSG